MKEKSSRSARAVVSKGRIIADLRKMGVNEGDHIAVVLSFKHIGWVEGGPEAFIDALLETVGHKGTVMMNTYTRNDKVFDYRSTPAWTGLVPETLRKRRYSVRSRHPVCSVTAVGGLANFLTEGHENSSPYRPYSKLAKVDGKYLCIGLGNNLVAIRHEAQHLAGFDVVPLFYGVRYIDDEGKTRIFFGRLTPCTEKLPELVPVLKKMGIIEIGRVGMAYSILAPARDLIDAMARMLKENPTLNLCGNVSCLWCREFERRMNLYGKIKNPKYFQKSNSIIKIVAFINRFRMKEYNNRFRVEYRFDSFSFQGRKKRLKFLILSTLTTFWSIFGE